MKTKILHIIFCLSLFAISGCSLNKTAHLNIYNSEKDSILKIYCKFINLTDSTLMLHNDFNFYSNYYKGGIKLYVEDIHGNEIKEDLGGCRIEILEHDTAFYLNTHDTLNYTFQLSGYKINGNYIKVTANYNEINSNELKINLR